jgi:hypothetical protein
MIFSPDTTVSAAPPPAMRQRSSAGRGVVRLKPP